MTYMNYAIFEPMPEPMRSVNSYEEDGAWIVIYYTSMSNTADESPSECRWIVPGTLEV